MLKNPYATIAAAIVLGVCLLTGFWIAHHKPIWNDEYYTAAWSVQNISHAAQWLGRIPEGNNTPLYYSLQKIFNQLTGYQVPAAWESGPRNTDPASQIVLRIVPVVCVSLSMAMVFYYFTRRYSLWAGLYSQFIYLSSYMLWVYWAEARPYALLVFLTTAQALLFLKIIESKDKGIRTWAPLAIVHILLAFTSVLSMGQISAACLLLWALWDRGWKKYLLLFVLPAVAILFYYFNAPKYPFYFDYTPEQLLRDNMSRDKFYILFIFAIFLMVRRVEAVRLAAPYFWFTTLVLAATAVILGLFALKQGPAGGGFPVSNRYFIYLMPVGIIATTLFSIAVLKALSNYRWLQWASALGIALLVVPRFFKIVPRAIQSIMGG